MKLSDKIQRDLTGDIILNDCPKWFKVQARNILESLQDEPIENYENITEMDRRLMCRYWQYHDGLSAIPSSTSFEDWFVNSATNPEILTRAVRWLREAGYIIIKPEVQRDAERKAEIIRGQIRK